MIKVNHVTFHVKPVKKVNKKIFNTITKPIYSEYKIRQSNGKYKKMDLKTQIDVYMTDLKSKYKEVKIASNE